MMPPIAYHCHVATVTGRQSTDKHASSNYRHGLFTLHAPT